jgi:hypothetical protein
MRLTEIERERISDSSLKIQSVRDSLQHVGKNKIPNEHSVEECLDSIDDSLREALGYRKPSDKRH